MKTACTAFMLLSQLLKCLASDDSSFELTNLATGFCLVKTNNYCFDLRWTTADRLLVPQRRKCLGVQGKSVGSETSLYDCDENSELQKWECKNETVLALKGQELYIELTADNTAVLSRTIGPNNHLSISGTTSGACTRTYRVLYAIGGNAAGLPCMFPFKYKDHWYPDCTTIDSGNRPWCAVETQYQSEQWGYCPTDANTDWKRHPVTGAYYQLNTQAALTWPQAETSCRQQNASLLSINGPQEQAYIMALLGIGGTKNWIGLILDPEHSWKWSNGRPFRYLNWHSGYPLHHPGHNCANVDPAVLYSWQSSPCSKKLGYICYKKASEELPTQAAETGFCSRPWIPYNGHCFYLNHTQKKWSDAQRQCRDGGGDLVSIRNVEDQSFIISQLGYTSTDELWIGLNDKKTEGLFDWADHSTVSFTSWKSGNPTVSRVKDCVLISGETGNWANHVCEEKHGFICMKMSSSQPPEEQVEQDVACKTGWRRHYSYCYFIGTETKTFHEASDDCKGLDSYLADVSNGVDNAFLVSLVGMRPERHFWLGLSNQKHIGEFVWTNTDSVRFTHWNTFMPGNRQGCVAIKTGTFAGLWEVLPCTNKEKYICKHLAEGASPTPPPPVLAPTDCAEDWVHMGLRNYCTKIFGRQTQETRTWFQARAYCRTIGGDLLSIHSAAEIQALRRLYRYDTVWIGLSAPDPANGYVWSDGSPLQFQHWEDDEPNNRNNVESCAEMNFYKSNDGSWNDVHCEKVNSWMCEIPSGVVPKQPPDHPTPDYNTTSDGWVEWNGNQYYMCTESLPMDDARKFCRMRHSDLVTINSEAESVFLWKQIQRYSYPYWIGLTVDLDRTFGWMDGSPVVFQRWDVDQPRFLNNDENCAVMTNEMGFWHDYNCGHDHRFICKRSGTPPVNTTVAPTVRPKGGCPPNWEKFDSKCYIIRHNNNETWDGAKQQCNAMGGNLASILSRNVQVFLTTKMAKAPDSSLWIGLRCINGDACHWTDGRAMRYSNWGIERPPEYQYNMDYGYEMNYHSIYSVRNEKVCVAMSTDPDIGIGKWTKLPCSSHLGYVCLRNVDSSIPDLGEPTTMDYVKILKYSFKAVTQQMTWDSARKHCEQDGAKLARIQNLWSDFYVELLALNHKGPLWIGMNMETGGYFRYVDGWPVPFTNWDQGEPSMERPCVYVDVNADLNVRWKTADCNQNMASICMKSKDVPPTESSDFPGFCPEVLDKQLYISQSLSWLAFQGYCYLFNIDNVEWSAASSHCFLHGGTLASIENPSEQEFIQNNIKQFEDSKTSFWIGLFKTHKGIWLWLDKSGMYYTNWARGLSDDSSFGYIKTSNGQWSAGNQRNERGYICKTPKVQQKSPLSTVSTVNLMDIPTRGRVPVVIVLVMTVIAIGTVIVLLLCKKSQSPVSKKTSTFDNPLFFNIKQSQIDSLDSNKLVINAERESGPHRVV